jgi:light-regulated signal transduction histidine kinase (bacteriophytochrome)/anti-sigma regulatory factor (Ser/Thr protein kinase)
MSDTQVAFGTADLTNCDRERIHVPGSIQPHGAMLVIEPKSQRIVQAGGDLKSLLGTSEPLGRSASDFLTAAACEKLRALRTNEPIRPQHLFTMERDETQIDAVVHSSGSYWVLEIDPRLENEPEDSLALVQSMIGQVQRSETVEKSYQAIVGEVRAASGFDRVMLYRFLSDGTGSVEAEARAEDVESYRGLRYPASDIPSQARALYLRNWIRLIADARYAPAPLVALESDAREIDLSHAALRSVSPIHLEYLANMGVVSSMSLSIIVDGKLWGLIACHHRSPRFPPYRLRVAFELFAQMASFQVETKLEAQDLGSRLRQKSISENLIADLSGEAELAEGLKRFRSKLLEYIPASGVGLWLDGQFSGLGSTPKGKEVALLVRWLNETMSDGVFYTDHLCGHYPPARLFASSASGILALSVSRTPRDYVIWFRSEVVQTVTWAGNPDKAAFDDGTRISPRKSFAQWKQAIRFRSEPWSGLDRKTALSLRLSLLEVVLQHTDQLARERERARVQQAALMAELDKRILQWEFVAEELKRESDRRAVVEAELSKVLRRTVLEQEAERQRIARELHDSLGQYLTVMRMDLESIGRDAQASVAIRQRVEKLKSLTTDVGQEVNQLAWEIRPTALDDLGLQTAIQQFLEEWEERSSLKFELHLALNERRLPAPIETALYRALQEAVRNVVKHAEATQIGVILEANSNEVRLIVEDDGKGFLWDGEGVAQPPDRLGLLGMRERLALVGGSLEVETSPGAGTTLLVHVPL